jgi:hypothetical protein
MSGVSSTTGIAEAASEDGGAATMQRLAGSGAAMTQKRRRDVAEVVRRSSVLCAVMRGIGVAIELRY